jgi:uncharacterized protein (TIGR03435 family)
VTAVPGGEIAPVDSLEYCQFDPRRVLRPLARDVALRHLQRFDVYLHVPFDSDRFDVSGKPNSPGLPTVKQMQVMMQKMLVDRFSLTFHKDKRELTAYAITVAKGGEKIQKETNANTPIPSARNKARSGRATTCLRRRTEKRRFLSTSRRTPRKA